MSGLRMPLLALLLLVVASLAVRSVLAAESFQASGTMTRVSSVLVGTSMEDDETLRAVRNTWNLQGTLTGTLVSDVLVVVRPDGTAEFTESGTFTGTVGGASGTLAWTGEGTGVGGDFQGQFTLSDGTGDLTKVEGEGTFSVHFPPGVGSYSGEIEFGG